METIAKYGKEVTAQSDKSRCKWLAVSRTIDDQPLTQFALLILRFANDRLITCKGVQSNYKLFTF